MPEAARTAPATTAVLFTEQQRWYATLALLRGGWEGLAAGDLAPGKGLVDADVARQAEHALAEDVLHDLAGAALDRVRPHAQERLLRVRPQHRVLRPLHRV